jgi:hypothetical protein
MRVVEKLYEIGDTGCKMSVKPVSIINMLMLVKRIVLHIYKSYSTP